MSELKIALIAEGKTDYTIIEAALKAIINQPFVINLLQPETSDALGGAGAHGGGWGGVYRWCRQLVSMGYPVGMNPSLTQYDLVLVHVDADVAGMNYTDANIDDGRTDLPCELPCPPPEDTVAALREVITQWLGLPSHGSLPPKWVFCNPSKSTETWIVAALYRDSQPAKMAGLECDQRLETWLSLRPIQEGARLIKGTKKQARVYNDISKTITDDWRDICHHCSQADRFGNEVQLALE